MKKTSSQNLITEHKKKSIIQQTPPFIEGLSNESQKNIWEHPIESPLDENKLYKPQIIEDTENSPTQFNNLFHKSSLTSKPLSNNFIDNPNYDDNRKDVIKLRQITAISDRKNSDDDIKERMHFSRTPFENERNEQSLLQDGPKTNLTKSVKIDKSKIIPGYTKNCIDDNNPDHNSVKGLFSESEIKEAFDTLDMNKNGFITADDLGFFLDVLEEEVQEEEIEEMIRLCDIEGNGKVKYEEFQRMSSGQSLAPIGQAYPPTFQMIERKKQLETMELKQNNSLAKMDFMKNFDNENSIASKKNDFDFVDNTILNKNKTQRGNENDPKNLNKGQIKASSEVKKINIKKFKELHALSGDKLMISYENLKQIDANIVLECDYSSFYKYFGLTDENNDINKNAFYALVDNEEKIINLKYKIISF